MKSFRDYVESWRRGPTDIIGVDVRPYGTPVVRLRKSGKDVLLVAADVLPPLALPRSGEGGDGVPALALPLALRAKHAAIALPGETAVIKLLSFPTLADAESDEKIVQSLGLADANAYRIGYKVLTRGHGKTESKTLAVAMPEVDAQVAAKLFPSGLPAPYSLEISELACLTAFLHGPCKRHSEEAVGALAFGAETSALALFTKGVPALVRRFSMGTNAFLERIEQTLGVDRATAAGIVSDGSFDISQPVGEAMDPLLKQLLLSRDFVERREDCHVSRLYVSGEMVESADVKSEINSGLGIDVETWNPFEQITVAPGAVTEKHAGQEWRFASALGVCLGVFEDT